MADLIITAANVKPISGTTQQNQQTGVAGEAMTAGQPVFLDRTSGSPTQGRYLKSDANDTTRAMCDGICITQSAALGQPITVVGTGAIIDIGATLTTGFLYVLSGNVGMVAPTADIVASWRVIVLGASLATNRFKINLWDTTAIR